MSVFIEYNTNTTTRGAPTLGVGSVTTLHIGYYYTDSPERPSKMNLYVGLGLVMLGCLSFLCLMCVKSNRVTNVTTLHRGYHYTDSPDRPSNIGNDTC